MNWEQARNDPAQFIGDVLSTIPVAKWIGYAALAGLIYAGVTLVRKYLAADTGLSISGLLRAAEKAKKANDLAQAGALFEQAGNTDRAIDAYREARAYEEVGRLYEQGRQWAQAAQFYKLAENVEKSTAMFQRAGQYTHAAEGYIVAKRYALAGEMYEKGKQYRDAAIQHERAGNFMKAANLYETAHEPSMAARLYGVYFQKQNREGASPEARSQAREAIRRSGELYLSVQQFQKAMEGFAAGGFPAQAADAAIKAGATEAAAQYYLEGELFEEAARLYESLGNPKQGHRVMANKSKKEGDALEAAALFERGESWNEAGEMYARAGQQVRAATMFMQAGEYPRAADLFLSVGDSESAALAYERDGQFKVAADLYYQLSQWDKAAETYELAEQHYDAAILFQKLGKIDQGISCLQRVGEHAIDYHRVSLLLGKFLIAKGMTEAARERFQKIISQQSISTRNLEFYYELAQIYEGDGEFEKAQSFYEKIMAEELSYRDVRSRTVVVKGKLSVIQKEGMVRKRDQVGADRYTRIEKIGQGGMGVVYRAEDTLLKRVVAYKVLPPAIRDNEEMLKGFMQEAQTAAALHHPNIVTLFDTGVNGDEVFITMEFVDGGSLKEYLEKQTPSLSDLLPMMQGICDGVAYAHGRSVIHRDLKPANIMLTQDRIPKIADFGLAKVMGESIRDKTAIKGTPLYMAPEQILGESVDQQADIYALGCIFFRMVAGHPPFTQGDVFYHHLHTPPPSPKSLNPSLPNDMEHLILKCLKKNKVERYKTVPEVLNDLKLQA
jgi:tetratricopeptide (TPR) repeat protein